MVMFSPEARIVGRDAFKPPFFFTGELPTSCGMRNFFFFLNQNRNAGVNSLPEVGHGKGLQSVAAPMATNLPSSCSTDE